MSKPAEHAISLTKRTATVTNLNLKPEKHGQNKEPRADLSLVVLLNEHELNQIVRTRWNDARKVLWDTDGEPQILDLEKHFDVSLEAEGTAELMLVSARKAIDFLDARMKKITIEPIMAGQATMRCQIRVDPTGHLEQLNQMCIDERCQFAFVGRGRSAKDENQEELNL